MRTLLLALLLAITASTSHAGAWRAGRVQFRDPSKPTIAAPSSIEAKWTEKTKVRVIGFRNETRAEVFAAHRVKTDAVRLTSIRCEYSILLKDPSGSFFVKRGHACNDEEKVSNINRTREDVIQAFKIVPNTKLVGYRIALFHRGDLMDEKKWTAKEVLDNGYSETWYEQSR